MANEFKPNVGSPVKKKEALKWIEKFDKERKKDTKSVFYGRDTFHRILKDPTITGISIFFCRKSDANGKEYDDLVLVGTKLDGTLVWNSNPTTTTQAFSAEEEDGGDDNGLLCPPHCPTGV